VSERREYELQSTRALSRCRDCRDDRRTEPRSSESHVRWWLDRYSLDEIREMAAGMFGD
jgi:hypothetical protein